jgi:hypothetical protein
VDAGSTASESLEGGDDADIPLVGVVDGSRVAQVGGLSVNEEYHAGVSELEHDPFLANLLESFDGRTGSVLVDGGHRQCNPGALQRGPGELPAVPRGPGLSCEQVHTVSRSKPSRGHVIVITPPAEWLTATEVDTHRAFRDDGGAILLLGSADASEPGTSTTSPARSAPTSDSTPTRCTTTAPTSTTTRRS